MKTNDDNRRRTNMKRSEERYEPQRFWSEAATLAGALCNTGREMTTNPLVWVAALEMAQEKYLEQGGPLMLADWHRARAGRIQLAEERDVTFSVMEVAVDD
jgi:hypothetical protein